MKTEVCIIGAGPAGLMAAVFSAESGTNTTVIEANTAAGRKLLVTGGGRCNLTHQAEPQELVRVFGAQGRFLRHALYHFPPQDVQDFFIRLGLATRIEKDGCVFPASDRSGDVRDLLVKQAKLFGVTFLYGKRVDHITQETDSFIVQAGRESLYAQKLILSTGGLSWPQTGCTGDGYQFAREFGHTIVPPKAALVPLVTDESWPGQLAGVAVNDVAISVRIENKKVCSSGAMVFTDDGVGGPAVQDTSRYLTDHLPATTKPIAVTLDLIPDLDERTLEARIIEHIVANSKKKLVNVLAEFVPRRLAAVLCRRAEANEELPAGQLKKDVRKKLVLTIKMLPLSIVRTRPIDEATVTRGGVCLTEVESKTMESKICPGLYFAGEILDVDGPCGGYNLQVCWSTGALAGMSASQSKK
ncbi:MAG: NAD(P)/FAD-dependent oxidoreductase [Sedimentisphaerales bacterium]|nr:NAD(P)/FAD-dependent oxidoreductase [Sedimentisphaerales bacterium]